MHTDAESCSTHRSALGAGILGPEELAGRCDGKGGDQSVVRHQVGEADPGASPAVAPLGGASSDGGLVVGEETAEETRVGVSQVREGTFDEPAGDGRGLPGHPVINSGDVVDAIQDESVVRGILGGDLSHELGGSTGCKKMKRGGRSERNMCRINIISLNREATTGRAKHMRIVIIHAREFKLELAAKQKQAKMRPTLEH